MGLGGFLGLGEVRDLYRKVGDIGGLHFHQVPSKSVPRGAKTSQKTVYLTPPPKIPTSRINRLRALTQRGSENKDLGASLGTIALVCRDLLRLVLGPSRVGKWLLNGLMTKSQQQTPPT